MKRLAVIVISLTAWMVSALEVLFFPTLAANMDDQVQYVMPHRGIHVPLVSKVESGQPFTLTISVASKEKLSKPLKLSATFTGKSPDGEEKVHFKDIPFFDIPAGAQGILSPGKYFAGVFETSDKPGKYTYILVLKDADGNSYRAESSLELVPQISVDRAMDAGEFEKTFTFYYRKPKPERLLAAWRYYLDEGVTRQQQKEGKNFNPMAILKGFCEAFKLNPQFHDDLAKISQGIPPEKYGYYAMVFGGLGKEFLNRYQKDINPEIMKLTAKFKGSDPLTFKEVVHAAQLDMLWLEFFVTGRFEPVKRLAGELSKKPVFPIEEAKKRQMEKKELSAAEKKQLMTGIIQMADVWSLKSNLKHHRLLGFYLETIMARKLYADEQAAGIIAAIFREHNSKNKEKK